MIKRIDCNLTQEQYDDVIRYIVIALKRFIKKETGGKVSISETPYAALDDKSKKVDCSLVALAAVNAVMYCQLHDEYYEAYYEQNPNVEQTEQVWRKKIEKSVFPRLKKGTPNVKNFQVRISKMVFNEYALLSLFALYPQADNAAEALKMLFTEIEFIANNSKMNSYTSSAGGKFSALVHFMLGIFGKQTQAKPLEEEGTMSDLVDLSDLKCTTLAEGFARTIAISLNYFYCFDRIYCGDADYGFVNYMEVIDKWCDEMIESARVQFKELADTFNHKLFHVKKFSKCINRSLIKRHIKKNKKGKITPPKIRRYYWRSKKTDEKYKNLLNKSRDISSKSRKDEKIAAAAALYIVINVSFSGNEKNAVSTLMDCFTKQLNKRVHNLRYLSANMPKIEYVHSDFRKTIRKFLNDPSVLLILDPPYLKEFGLPCKDYVREEVNPNKKEEENPFTYEDMLDMFKLLKNAKCRVILFHSRSYWFDSTAVSYGLRKVGYYVGRNIGKKYKPYYTEVYSLNIDPSVKFFDPKNHGELYWGGCE